MPSTVFNGAAIAIHLQQALFGEPASHAVLTSHTAQANADAVNFAFNIANPFAATGNADLALQVLGNVGINASTVTAGSSGTTGSYALLLSALEQVFASFGPASRGQIILNLTNILANLEDDATYGAAALSYNNATAAVFAQGLANTAAEAIVAAGITTAAAFAAATQAATATAMNAAAVAFNARSDADKAQAQATEQAAAASVAAAAATQAQALAAAQAQAAAAAAALRTLTETDQLITLTGNSMEPFAITLDRSKGINSAGYAGPVTVTLVAGTNTFTGGNAADTAIIGSLNQTGTLALGAGANLVTARDGGVLGGTITALGGTASLTLDNGSSVSMSADNYQLFNAMGATITANGTSSNGETITLSTALTGGAVLNASIEKFNLAAGVSNSVKLGAATQNVTANSGADTISVAGYAATGKLTALGPADTLQITASGNIAGASFGSAGNETAGAATGAGTVNITGAVTMTAAQHNGFTALAATGTADQITLTNAFVGTANAAIETYVLADFANTVTLGATGGSLTQNVAGGSSTDVLTLGAGVYSGNWSSISGLSVVAGSDISRVNGGAAFAGGGPTLQITGGGTVTMTAAQYRSLGTITAPSTHDTIRLTTSLTGAAILNGEVETFVLVRGNNSVTVGATGQTIDVTALSSNLTLSGSLAATVILSDGKLFSNSSGNTTVKAGRGYNTIKTGSGADTIDGGAGRDFIDLGLDAAVDMVKISAVSSGGDDFKLVNNFKSGATNGDMFNLNLGVARLTGLDNFASADSVQTVSRTGNVTIYATTEVVLVTGANIVNGPDAFNGTALLRALGGSITGPIAGQNNLLFAVQIQSLGTAIYYASSADNNIEAREITLVGVLSGVAVTNLMHSNFSNVA